MLARRAASWLPPAHTASGTSTANSHLIPDSQAGGRSPVPLRSWRARTGGWASQALDTGNSYAHVMTKAGSFSYICTIHPFMHGTVVVRP